VAVLRAAVLLAIVGCYAPDAPDCTLACSAGTDCISGQACTTDHMCAATSVTTCGVQATIDGSLGSDAGNGSGNGSGDGSGSDGSGGHMDLTLTIHIDKDGSVRTSNNDVCTSPTNQPVACTYQVQAGAALTLTAIPNIAKQFDKWDPGACNGQTAMCHTTPQSGFTVSVKFKMMMGGE
jgi:hypothetical protein